VIHKRVHLTWSGDSWITRILLRAFTLVSASLSHSSPRSFSSLTSLHCCSWFSFKGSLNEHASGDPRGAPIQAQTSTFPRPHYHWQTLLKHLRGAFPLSTPSSPCFKPLSLYSLFPGHVVQWSPTHWLQLALIIVSNHDVFTPWFTQSRPGVTPRFLLPGNQSTIFFVVPSMFTRWQ